jgi:hypothetical protein
MADFGLQSRCGIYCGACYVYRAERDYGKFLREIAEWQKVEIDEVQCNGCLAPEAEKWPNCQKCYPISCLKEKGLEFCYECPEFDAGTCEEYTKYEEFTRKRGERIRLNLLKMKLDPEKYLREMDKKWRCPSCGESYSWYEEKCHHCGKNLNRLDLKL